MTIRTAVVILASVFVFGCGGAKKGAEDAGDAASDAGDTAGDVAGDAGDAAGDAGDAAGDAGDAGGIVRDADGDGEEDKAMACGDMPETRCKISADCAWSDDGKCVEAGGGM